MPTEKFLLIPRNMFKTEQSQVSQILNSPVTKNKSKQPSLLQRNSKQESTEAVIQQNTEQQTDDFMVSDEKEKHQCIPDDTKRKEFVEISQSVIDAIDFLDKDKFGKAKKILKKSTDLATFHWTLKVKTYIMKKTPTFQRQLFSTHYNKYHQNICVTIIKY